MRPKDQNLEFNRHLAVLGHHFFVLLAGRSELNGRTWGVPESSPYKRWEWVKREKLQERIEEYQKLGWTVWISLNDIEPGHMTVDSVRHVAVVWFDIDAPRTDKTIPADEEERLIAKFDAEKMKKFLEEKYGAQCFLASSGNGYHIYCPIPAVELATASESWDFNAKLKNWMKSVREGSGVEFDHTYNINRLVQPIGYPNRKIPKHPLPTYWYDHFNLGDVEEARGQNATLAESILTIELDNSPTEKPERVQNHPSLEELMRRDRWLENMYYGY